jgi:chloride channel 7
MDSLTYEQYESDVYKAHVALDHMHHRGSYWNSGKHETLLRYLFTALIEMCQAGVAYFVNLLSAFFIGAKFETVYALLENGHTVSAFCTYVAMQVFCAAIFVWIEPISAGSGIPEVKCFLNGIDLPNVGAPRTLLCKALGIVCSVSAGLPVGKEGPMVHAGAIVAATLTSGKTRNDREVRDFVACGAAVGVCTAFSAPIGGILFALEEGASYWKPSLTWRTFFCSMMALTTTMYCLNSVGSEFGKVGFNKLFSFGNFVYEGKESSFAVHELILVIVVGAMGGVIGAIFNSGNERITHWRIKSINHSKKRRFVEVILVATLVSVTQFLLFHCYGSSALRYRSIPKWKNKRPI